MQQSKIQIGLHGLGLQFESEVYKVGGGCQGAPNCFRRGSVNVNEKILLYYYIVITFVIKRRSYRIN